MITTLFKYSIPFRIVFRVLHIKFKLKGSKLSFALSFYYIDLTPF